MKWTMPNVPIHKLYEYQTTKKLFTFSTKIDRSIRITEGQISFGNGGGSFKLYKQAPSSYGQKGKFYSVMNIGLVQIGVKTITRKIPSNASIILCVRDNRIEKVEDSIIAMVESKLGDGPFYFNVFPNMNFSLFEASLIMNVLSVHVLVKGFDQLAEGSEPIVVSCRTCYKLNQTKFGPEALLESPVGKTVFFQTQIVGKLNGGGGGGGGGGGDVVQKVTQWDQVHLPSNWPPQLHIPRFPNVFKRVNG